MTNGQFAEKKLTHKQAPSLPAYVAWILVYTKS